MSGRPEPGPAAADSDPSEILDFLGTAPESVRGWAREQAQKIRQDQLRQRDAEKRRAAAESGPIDENELALAELDEVEDETPVFRKRAKRRAAKAAAAESAPVRPGSSDRRVILISLVVALIVGISSGAYFANQAQDGAAAAEQMQMPAGHPDISDSSGVSVARLAELEARVMADPEDLEALIQLGALRFDNGEVDAAEEHWLTVLEIDPDAVEAHYNLGFAYSASTPPRWDEAVEAWSTVVELAPGSELAENAERHISAVESESAGGDADDNPEETPSPVTGEGDGP